MDGKNLQYAEVDLAELHRQVGMVFQKPNPFPQSRFDNVAFGPQVLGMDDRRRQLNSQVEHSLPQPALWHEIKDQLNEEALELSLRQQQRRCPARLLATEPEVILIDEPA